MKPNILIVMTDQQRADLRKAEGYPLDTMPFLDEWSQSGTDFRGAYTPNPTCMPARVSLFTGRYPNCHHVRTNHNAVDAFYTDDLLDVLKQAGYRTALCGKNHSHRALSDFDFCEANGHDGPDRDYDRSPAEKKFDTFMKSLRHRECHEPSPCTVQEQQPYRNVSAALRFMDSLDRDQPFFAWVSFAEPHNPYQVPAPYFDMFPPESLPPLHTSTEDLAAKGHRYPWLRACWETAFGEDTERNIARTRSNYHGMLRLIDDQFRRLIEGVRARGLYDNTIILFVSDHGDFSGEYGLIRKGPDLPELLARIPMAWHVPNLPAQGSKSSCFTNLVDVFPTLCDLAGLEVPFGVQGKSLVPLLDGSDSHREEFAVAYAETGFSGLYWNERDGLNQKAEGAINPGCTYDCLNTWTQSGQVRMARKGKFKIQADMMGIGYLYDLENDPFEVDNLWDDPAHLATKADMLATLLAETLKANDPLPAPRNRYRTKIHPKGYWHDPDFVADDPGVRVLDPVLQKKR